MPSPEEPWDRPAHWQAVVDRYQSERRLPTLLAGVLVDLDLTWVGQAGAPVGVDTQFRIGSITKTMTALLVLRCRDEGLLTLDDPLGRFVPAGSYSSRTLRSLLAHVSGMQSEPAGPWWERSPGTTLEELLAANAGAGVVFDPDQHYHYSNLGYALLGAVVAQVRGRPWWDVVQADLLRPLSMSRTSYLPEQPFAAGWSVDHLAGTLTPEPLHDTGAMAPAGQLWSTIGDLARFARHLAAPDLKEMRQPVPPAAEYGLGMRLVPYTDGILAGHTGSMPGFQATVLVNPLSGDGVAALTNATTGFNGPELALALLGDTTPAPLAPWVPTRGVPGWAEELLGWWFWGNSAFEVRWHNERLEFRDLARNAVAEQFDQCEGRIVGVAGYHHGETLHVHRGPGGGVDRLECATFVYTRAPYPEGP